MTDQIETAPATKPERTQARAVLASRIQARERAMEAVVKSQAAGERLLEHGRQAAALAAKLDAERAADAQRLAQHALSGEADIPKLTDSARIQLHADLIEARSQAEAAQPAIQQVATRTAELGQIHHQAAVAVQPCIQPILAQEAGVISEEIRDLSAKLHPLHQRMRGLRQFIFSTAYAQQGDDRRHAYLTFGSELDALIASLGISGQTPPGDFEDRWAAFSAGLATNPDLERP